LYKGEKPDAGEPVRTGRRTLAGRWRAAGAFDRKPVAAGSPKRAMLRGRKR